MSITFPIIFPSSHPNRGSDPTKWVQKADETHRELERHGWSDEVAVGMGLVLGRGMSREILGTHDIAIAILVMF